MNPREMFNPLQTIRWPFTWILLISLNFFIIQTIQAQCGPTFDPIHSADKPAASVLSMETTRFLKGVVFQASSQFRNSDHQIINPTEVEITSYDKTEEKLKLTYGGKDYSISVAEKLLEMIVNWIENKGTGFFTYRNFTEQDREIAGLKQINGASHISAEFFSDAELHLAGHFLDFASDDFLFQPKNESEILQSHNESRIGNRAIDLDWVVSDLDSNFSAQLVNDEVQITGTLYKYHRCASNDPKTVYVHKVEALRNPDDLPFKTRESRAIKLGLSIARIVSVLRAIKRDNAQGWDRFTEWYFED